MLHEKQSAAKKRIGQRKNQGGGWDRPLAIDPSPNVRLGMTATT